jgi:hypothetical protein
MIFFPISHAVLGSLTSCCLAEFVGAISYCFITLDFIINFFAGAEIFLFGVPTNGSGTVSSLGLALFNISWIHKLVLGWVVFFPSSHAVVGSLSHTRLAEIPRASSRVSFAFLL